MTFLLALSFNKHPTTRLYAALSRRLGNHSPPSAGMRSNYSTTISKLTAGRSERGPIAQAPHDRRARIAGRMGARVSHSAQAAGHDLE